jgi:hypothetical protein
MFQLYKQREFGALISDTFTFFRVNGRNYFRNYILVNGGLLLILLLLIFLVGKVFFDAVFSNFGSPATGVIVQSYFNDNMGFFIGTGILAGILIIFITILSFSYPVLYLQLYEKNPAPAAKQILAALKSNAKRIIIFSLLWLVTFLPLIVMLFLLSILLIAVIVGIPVAIFLFGCISCWMSLSFYDYLNTGNGYFTSMRNGFTMLFSKFWPYAGSTSIFYIIIYMLEMMISMIPYLIGMLAMVTDSGSMQQNGPSQDNMSFAGIMMIISFMLSILLSYVLGNVLFINQGLIYYSSREENENRSAYSEIDLIGRDAE